MDAMGADQAADVELAVVQGGRDLILKTGSARRSFVRLPDDADAGAIVGELADGQFKVMVPVAKK
jgi:hypothetical protein